MSTQNTSKKGASSTHKILFAVVVVLAFFASYQIAQAVSSGSQGDELQYATSAQGIAEQASASSSGCSCCGTSGSGEAIEGAAVLGEDGVQRIAVDVANGYDPNVIRLQAGVPASITFGQGSGCMAEVMSSELGFFEDLQSGPKTIDIDPLEPGTYGFSCGMEMVFGQIVVE